VLYAVQAGVLARRSWVSVGGKPSRRGARLPGAGLIGALAWAIGGLIGVLYGLVVYGSLVRLWGADDTFTLQNYPQAWHLAWRDVRDSLVLALIAAPLTTALGFALAYLTERRHFLGRRALEALALVTFALPGTVAGIGYALAFSHAPLVLTGTASIVVLLFTFRNLPVGMKAAGAALSQIDPSLEEAARSLGAGPWATLRRVTTPLLAPAVFASLASALVRALTAVSAVIFVVSGSWNVVTVAILGLVETSELSQAAALSVSLVVIVLVLLGLIQLGMGRLFVQESRA
jgi:iron(III) transport system permease protein